MFHPHYKGSASADTSMMGKMQAPTYEETSDTSSSKQVSCCHPTGVGWGYCIKIIQPINT